MSFHVISILEIASFFFTNEIQIGGSKIRGEGIPKAGTDLAVPCDSQRTLELWKQMQLKNWTSHSMYMSGCSEASNSHH